MAEAQLGYEELKQAFEQYPPIMTTADVADMLAMNVQEVRRLTRDGRLPARRIGKAYRYFRDELVLWLYESVDLSPAAGRERAQ